MTAKAEYMYKSALENKSFLIDIYEADGDKPPGISSSSTSKYVFIAGYYGWLVGKYGKYWKSHL